MWARRWPTLLLLALLALLAQGCGYDQGDDDDSMPSCNLGPTLDQLQKCVFTPSCANFTSCHNDTKRFSELGSTFMSLATPETTCKTLVNVESKRVPGRMRLVPGSPDLSYLVNKMENMIDPTDRAKTPPTGGGRAMPFSNNPDRPTLLSQERRDALREWVAQGAPGCQVTMDGGVGDGGPDANLDANLDATQLD